VISLKERRKAGESEIIQRHPGTDSDIFIGDQCTSESILISIELGQYLVLLQKQAKRESNCHRGLLIFVPC
jgi:hypothetical protein